MIFGWIAAFAADRLILPANPAPVAADPLLDVVALHLRRDGQGVDQRTLGLRYDAVCGGGRGLACSWRSWDDRGRVRPAELARLADPLCVAGDPVACAMQGWALGIGDGTWNGPAVPAAAAQLTTACARQVRRACTELGDLVATGGVDGPDPLALHAYACALGEPAGCRRAAALAPSPAVAEAFVQRAGPTPGGDEGCALGFVAACETVVAGQKGLLRVATLERLCALSEDRWCPELARARVADPSLPVDPPPDNLPDSVWFVPGGVLLGWLGPTFRDHLVVPFAELRWVELLQEPNTLQDGVVLVTGDDPMVERVVPVFGCDAVTTAAGLLVDGGVDVRAVRASGGPTRSVCLERSGPGHPEIHGGEIRVDPRLMDDVGPATERKAALEAASPGLFACLAGATPRDPWVAEIVHRQGPPSKVKPVGSSRDPAFDACALAWLAGTDLGASDVTIKYTVRAELW